MYKGKIKYNYVMKNLFAIVFIFLFFTGKGLTEKNTRGSYIQDLLEVEKVFLLDTALIKIGGILPKIINDNIYVIYNYPNRKDNFTEYKSL